MNILLATPEAYPYIKTGGLADVTGALLKEFRKRKKKVRLFLPLYRTIRKHFPNLKDTNLKLTVPVGNIEIKGRVFHDGQSAFFIECDQYFDRDEPYGTSESDYLDNAARFAFFSRAILETCKSMKFKPDIIHCNDWQTGLVPLYLKTLYRDDTFFHDTVTVLTIHNIGYQGLFPPSDLFSTGLGWDLYNPEGVEFYGKINFLKAGIISADILTTVSETYAKEILLPEYGFGLDGVLKKREADLYGVMNGIDNNEWDPKNDTFLPMHYSSKDLGGKKACKREVLKHFFRASYVKNFDELPLFGMVGRLAEQKGLDSLIRAFPEISRFDAKFVILGKGEDFFQRTLSDLAQKYKTFLSMEIAFDEQLAHRTYAGCDFFVMPSRYEPCGLGQLISMRYGCIPIARKTGGLADTIEDYNPLSAQGTGFLFVDYTPFALLDAIKRALCLYTEKNKMQKVMRNGMAMNYSWSRSAESYLQLYAREAGKRG